MRMTGKCSDIRANLSRAIMAVYDAWGGDKISIEEAEKLAHRIAVIADDSFKVCPAGE